MAATKSLLGVTTKDVVVATTTDQLVTINRRLIDPRRPDANKLTESDKKEGLFPYDPRLGIPHTSFLTQNSSVPRLRTVLTFPDPLESNSLVFAVGLDLLWIPVSPAKNFDMLRHDFSRVGLFVSVLFFRCELQVLADLLSCFVSRCWLFSLDAFWRTLLSPAAISSAVGLETFQRSCFRCFCAVDVHPRVFDCGNAPVRNP